MLLGASYSSSTTVTCTGRSKFVRELPPNIISIERACMRSQKDSALTKAQCREPFEVPKQLLCCARLPTLDCSRAVRFAVLTRGFLQRIVHCFRAHLTLSH